LLLQLKYLSCCGAVIVSLFALWQASQTILIKLANCLHSTLNLRYAFYSENTSVCMAWVFLVCFESATRAQDRDSSCVFEINLFTTYVQVLYHGGLIYTRKKLNLSSCFKRSKVKDYQKTKSSSLYKRIDERRNRSKGIDSLNGKKAPLNSHTCVCMCSCAATFPLAFRSFLHGTHVQINEWSTDWKLLFI